MLIINKHVCDGLTNTPVIVGLFDLNYTMRDSVFVTPLFLLQMLGMRVNLNKYKKCNLTLQNN